MFLVLHPQRQDNDPFYSGYPKEYGLLFLIVMGVGSYSTAGGGNVEGIDSRAGIVLPSPLCVACDPKSRSFSLPALRGWSSPALEALMVLLRLVLH
ncbi:hypothetical protein cyc_03643 [Cyclospora cayetanensis]|uniref:Uncharacterized protein n=1 Tax=Cyclospora cayetanensis TaxID=88456 RepID=A0A1D3D844_9EIME|nr:hypothetical protein cyc_03643 [Cyclospora cayetanensis]